MLGVVSGKFVAQIPPPLPGRIAHWTGIRGLRFAPSPANSWLALRANYLRANYLRANY